MEEQASRQSLLRLAKGERYPAWFSGLQEGFAKLGLIVRGRGSPGSR